MKHPDLIEDLGALRLVDALDGEVLDGFLLPPLVDRRVLAAADGLVDVEVVHGGAAAAGGGGGRGSSPGLRLGLGLVICGGEADEMGSGAEGGGGGGGERDWSGISI